jgi:hypothetical protein
MHYLMQDIFLWILSNSFLVSIEIYHQKTHEHKNKRAQKRKMETESKGFRRSTNAQLQ